ncbi:hypothetical protein JXB01_01520 [Candidatus Micrarchaeota archaeon]|nr:hypothetical protein [Candidatus Micrarchaeota archaeon]
MRPILLTQQTKFCRYAGEKVMDRFGKFLAQGTIINGYRNARDFVKKMTDPERSIILIWSDGMSHNCSNILNIRRSVKYVYDNHQDRGQFVCGRDPCYDAHNTYSEKQEILLRVCYLATEGRNRFFEFAEGENNGFLHISVDLDFLKGFPALPWMSTGSTKSVSLLKTVVLGAISQDLSFTRFDIGGFREYKEDDFPVVYQTYYEPLLSLAIRNMLETS